MQHSMFLESRTHTSTYFVAAELESDEYLGNNDFAIWAIYDTADGERMIWVNELAKHTSIAGRGLERRYNLNDPEVLEIRDCVRDASTR